MSFEREIRVTIPEGATEEDEERIIDAAVDKEVDKIVDDVLRDMGF